MKNKKILSAVSALLIAVCLSSCESESSSNVNVIVNTGTADQDNSIITDAPAPAPEQIEPVVGGTDTNGYTITAVAVTDKKGTEVTDDAGKKVTEIAVVNEQGKIVTDSKGNAAKPEMPVVTSSQQHIQPSDDASLSPSDIPSTENGLSGILWITKLTQKVTAIEDGKTVNKNALAGVSGTGQLFTVTAKINASAPDGNYKISFGRKTDADKGSFCSENEMNYNLDYIPAVITVGSAEPEKAEKPSGPSVSLSSVTAKPGDTVTIECTLTGAPGLSAFNTFINYDPDIITIESIDEGELLAGKGDFLSS